MTKPFISLSRRTSLTITDVGVAITHHTNARRYLNPASGLSIYDNSLYPPYVNAFLFGIQTVTDEHLGNKTPTYPLTGDKHLTITGANTGTITDNLTLDRTNFVVLESPPTPDTQYVPETPKLQFDDAGFPAPKKWASQIAAAYAGYAWMSRHKHFAIPNWQAAHSRIQTLKDTTP